MRLGDYIDDYCSRCKRSTDHSIVAMAGEEVVQTRCRTCDNEHKYRFNKGRTKELTAREAFDKVLSTVGGAEPEPAKPSARSKK